MWLWARQGDTVPFWYFCLHCFLKGHSFDPLCHLEQAPWSHSFWFPHWTRGLGSELSLWSFKAASISESALHGGSCWFMRVWFCPPPSSLTCSLHGNWGLHSTNHWGKANMRTPELLTHRTHGGKQNPKGWKGMVSGSLLTPNSLISLFTYSDSGSEARSSPCLSHASSAWASSQCNSCPIYEVILGHRILDHPQWPLHDRGFYPWCHLKLTQSPTTNWTVLKKIYSKLTITRLLL